MQGAVRAAGAIPPQGRTRRRVLFRSVVLAVSAAAAGGVWVALGPGCPGLLPPPDPSDFVEAGAIEGRVLDEAVARKLFPANREGTKYVFDPLAYSVLRPGFSARIPWPEHPAGGYVERTNNLGFREDEPTFRHKRDLRVLVLGDSHTEGVAANDETYPHVLEARLAARGGGREVEVLNLAVGATGPWSYRGMLEKWKGLDPDLVLAALFTGNDFWDALHVADFFSKRRPRRPPRGYRRKIQRASRIFPVSQGVNQAYRFHFFPGEADLALGEAVRAFLSIDERCRAIGARFLALILPTKEDVDGEDDRKRFEGGLRGLGLTPEDYAIHQRLARRFAARLRARGIRVVDATASMQAVSRPLYWRRDRHLSVAGHEVVADLLVEPVREMLGIP